MNNSMRFIPLIVALPLFAMVGQNVRGPSLSMTTRNNDKVLICHHAGPRKLIEIEVSENAVEAHVTQHGDTIGSCEEDGGGDT